jgi:hypothetical protein
MRLELRRGAARSDPMRLTCVRRRVKDLTDPDGDLIEIYPEFRRRWCTRYSRDPLPTGGRVVARGLAHTIGGSAGRRPRPIDRFVTARIVLVDRFR